MLTVVSDALALAACCALVVAWVRRRAARLAGEIATRPPELRAAELTYREALFRTERPFPLVAKLDRAYRLRSGVLVLVELKTRKVDRPYASDVIQLSAQKLAIEGRTGERVAPYAFVSVLRPTGWRSLRHHRVALLTAEEVEALRRRREAIVVGRASAQYARSREACAECAFRARCDQGLKTRSRMFS